MKRFLISGLLFASILSFGKDPKEDGLVLRLRQSMENDKETIDLIALHELLELPTVSPPTVKELELLLLTVKATRGKKVALAMILVPWIEKHPEAQEVRNRTKGDPHWICLMDGLEEIERALDETQKAPNLFRTRYLELIALGEQLVEIQGTTGLPHPAPAFAKLRQAVESRAKWSGVSKPSVELEFIKKIRASLMSGADQSLDVDSLSGLFALEYVTAPTVKKLWNLLKDSKIEVFKHALFAERLLAWLKLHPEASAELTPRRIASSIGEIIGSLPLGEAARVSAGRLREGLKTLYPLRSDGGSEGKDLGEAEWVALFRQSMEVDSAPMDLASLHGLLELPTVSSDTVDALETILLGTKATWGKNIVLGQILIPWCKKHPEVRKLVDDSDTRHWHWVGMLEGLNEFERSISRSVSPNEFRTRYLELIALCEKLYDSQGGRPNPTARLAELRAAVEARAIRAGHCNPALETALVKAVEASLKSGEELDVQSLSELLELGFVMAETVTKLRQMVGDSKVDASKRAILLERVIPWIKQHSEAAGEFNPERVALEIGRIVQRLPGGVAESCEARLREAAGLKVVP